METDRARTEAIRAWAREIAALLPPMTDQQIRYVAELAARIDGRAPHYDRNSSWGILVNQPGTVAVS